MDEKDESRVETSTFTHEYYMYVIKRTLQLIVPVSVFSFLFSYFWGSSVFVSYNLQFPTPVFPLFYQALDRKYMFLICNGILAFLAKNLKFGNYGAIVEKSSEYGMQQVTELPLVLEVAAVHDDVASVEDDSEDNGRATEEQEQEQDRDGVKEIEGIETGDFILEEIVKKKTDNKDNYDNESEENASVDGMTDAEEVNDAQVSTEELNKKFEEFIRKMKEEIRIEAQQKLIAA